MLRQTFVQSSRQVARSARLFTTSTRSFAEGDLGAPRAGGGDSFNKREKFQEDSYVREQEMNKLHLLRQKLKDQKKAIEELEKDLDAMVDENSKSGKQ